MKSKILIYIFLPMILLTTLVLAKEYESSLVITPNQLTVQPCGIATYDITIKNLGTKEDTFYSLVEGIPEDWYTLTHESVLLKPGESKTVYLFITANCYSEQKNYFGKISYLGNSESTGSFQMNVITDHSLKIEVPTTISSCLCEESTIFATIENTGKYDEDVMLSVEGATLKENKIRLKPGESKEVELIFEKMCDVQPGEYKVVLNANSTSSYARTSAQFNIQRDKCYDFETSYDKELKACINESADLKITVKNIGTKEDTFRIGIEALNFDQSATLKPGESKDFTTTFTGNEQGTVDIGFSVKSNVKTLQGVIRFNVEKCYGVDLQPEKNKLEIKMGSGELLRAKLINTGTRDDTYTISSDVNWVSIRPKNIMIKASESGDVFVYYSPEFGALGEYNTKIKAESLKASDEETIQINVVEELTEQPSVEPTGIEINITPITQANESVVPTGKVGLSLENVLRSKVVVALIAGIFLTLIIFGLIYLLVMRE